MPNSIRTLHQARLARAPMARVRLAFVLCALCAPLQCYAGGGEIYSFTDASGQLHISNYRVDSRYRIDHRFRMPARRSSADASRAAGGRAYHGRFDKVIRKAARRTGVDPALLHAVIKVESGYDPRAVSARGAAGLMQLMPATARRYHVSDVFNPAQNVRAGAEYLAALLKTFNNDLRLALAAYNAGATAVVRHGWRVPPYRETVDYVPKVVEAYRQYRWGS
jgi:soluble lytic murein transglycosylase-like protein